ncbi:hypothetical protein VTI28DRAFT_3391 [Corynascus sepedonium]
MSFDMSFADASATGGWVEADGRVGNIRRDLVRNLEQWPRPVCWLIIGFSTGLGWVNRWFLRGVLFLYGRLWLVDTPWRRMCFLRFSWECRLAWLNWKSRTWTNETRFIGIVPDKSTLVYW